MLSEGIQSEDLCRIRSGSGDKKTTGVDEEKKAAEHLHEQVPHQPGPPDSDRPRNYISSGPLQRPDLRTNPRPRSPSGPRLGPSKLVYKLENIQLEYETIRSRRLADEATSTYTNERRTERRCLSTSFSSFVYSVRV